MVGIRNMTIPKDCKKCDLVIRKKGNRYACFVDKILIDNPLKRREDCPLIEIDDLLLKAKDFKLTDFEHNVLNHIKEEKNLFALIVEAICLCAKDPGYKKEVQKIDLAFRAIGVHSLFTQERNERDILSNIDFFYYVDRNKGYNVHVYGAEINHPNKDSKPHCILKWNKSISELLAFIKKRSPVLFEQINLYISEKNRKLEIELKNL